MKEQKGGHIIIIINVSSSPATRSGPRALRPEDRQGTPEPAVPAVDQVKDTPQATSFPSAQRVACHGRARARWGMRDARINSKVPASSHHHHGQANYE
jgi:hypothetical protein